jgi:hypothetical protein
LAIVATTVLGAAAGWVVWQLPDHGFPTWLAVAAPVACLTVFLVGLLNYDLLVFAAFCLIGYVRVEPAPSDLLLMVVLGMGLLTGRLRWPSSRQGTIVQIGLWALIVTNLLSTVAATSIYHSLRFLSITLYLLALLLFVRMYATTPRAVGIVLIGYSVSAIINSLVVVLSFLGINLPVPAVTVSLRGFGFFKDANVYGPFVAVAALWVADHVVQRPFSLSRTVPLLAIAGLLGAGVMLSLSRGAWLNLAFGGFIYFALLLRGAPRPHITRFLVSAIVILLAAAFLVQFLGLGNAIAGRWHSHGYDELRFDIQRRGVQAGLSHPVGVGPGGWPSAHSLYVRTLAEHGPLGLTALGLLIGALVIPLVRRASWKPGKTQVLSDGVLLAWIGGLLVNSLVIDAIHWRHLWFVLGLAWASLVIGGKEE